ncbi:hypothetical protein [Streptomyces brasiliensis]|uniref:Uncharacterized protein n=1 Tax=Streptomyces brasiliensis TaxID=1954 RepID=A0A917UKV7_9ACTN|nr:hypothetical protein [Streptomyces brasiliensis]GGJ64991.1 hypothetical protein GCM10010121_089550 [Streptomyces brasiliensis]
MIVYEIPINRHWPSRMRVEVRPMNVVPIGSIDSPRSGQRNLKQNPDDDRGQHLHIQLPVPGLGLHHDDAVCGFVWGMRHCNLHPGTAEPTDVPAGNSGTDSRGGAAPAAPGPTGTAQLPAQ